MACYPTELNPFPLIKCPLHKGLNKLMKGVTVSKEYRHRLKAKDRDHLL